MLLIPVWFEGFIFSLEFCTENVSSSNFTQCCFQHVCSYLVKLFDNDQEAKKDQMCKSFMFKKSNMSNLLKKLILMHKFTFKKVQFPAEIA